MVKDSDGRVVKESKVGKDEGEVLRFLDGTHASVVMESGYNHQFIRDLLMEKGYEVKVAHPLMVKAIAYAKVKSDKVDVRTLADLLRTDMIPESYVPDQETRDLRDLVRRRHYLVQTRTTFEQDARGDREEMDKEASGRPLHRGRKKLPAISQHRCGGRLS